MWNDTCCASKARLGVPYLVPIRVYLRKTPREFREEKTLFRNGQSAQYVLYYSALQLPKMCFIHCIISCWRNDLQAVAPREIFIPSDRFQARTEFWRKLDSVLFQVWNGIRSFAGKVEIKESGDVRLCMCAQACVCVCEIYQRDERSPQPRM